MELPFLKASSASSEGSPSGERFAFGLPAVPLGFFGALGK